MSSFFQIAPFPSIQQCPGLAFHRLQKACSSRMQGIAQRYAATIMTGDDPQMDKGKLVQARADTAYASRPIGKEAYAESV